MKQHFTIQGRFCSLNDFYRMNHYEQGRTKRAYDELVAWSAKAARLKPVRKTATIDCLWFEQNRKRDFDNIVFGCKFILDGLVKAGILKDDSPRYVERISHAVSYDRNNPRIEVWISE